MTQILNRAHLNVLTNDAEKLRREGKLLLELVMAWREGEERS